MMETNLEYTVSKGSKLEIVQFLKRPHVNVQAVNSNGNTVLHLVLRNDELLENEMIEVLKIFINQEVDSNIKNNEQLTALHLALARWSTGITDYLLKHNARIDEVDHEGNSMLHFHILSVNESFQEHSKYTMEKKNEIERASIDFTEWLLLKGFDVDVKNKKGQSALHLTIDYNLQHILPCLLKHTHDVNFVNDNGESLLHLFCRSANKTLLACYEVHSRGQVVMSPKRHIQSSDFSKRYEVEIIRILIEKGVSVERTNKDGVTPLHLAISTQLDGVYGKVVREEDKRESSKDTMEIVHLLMEHFTKLNEECGFSLICLLLEFSLKSDYHFKILAALIAKGFNLTNKDDNGGVLYHAVRVKNLRAIELIKKAGADFRWITSHGSNFLHVLAGISPTDDVLETYQEEIFQILVNEGCDVNAMNKEAATPLHVAVSKTNISLARHLIACGADVNCRKGRDLTPILLVLKKRCSDERVKMLKVLLEHKAEVNVRNEIGYSALARAVYLDFKSTIEELLAYGADISDDCVKRVCKSKRRKQQPISEVLSQHLLKLHLANLPFPKELECFLRPEENQILYHYCLSEIDKLKSKDIDSQTSLYQWLHMNSNRRYLYNEKLETLVKSDKLAKQFPHYSIVILGMYHETEARRRLLEPAKKVWLKLTEIEMPDICLEHIFMFLNTGDLFEFIERANGNFNLG